jgi:hypothetical protein
MSSPEDPTIPIREIEVVFDGVNTVGFGGEDDGEHFKHFKALTRNKMGKDRQYRVGVNADNAIVSIVRDYGKEKEQDDKDSSADARGAVVDMLERADTYEISFIEDFHDHTADYDSREIDKLLKKFLATARRRIESSTGQGDFTLLVTDPEGSEGEALKRWRLSGWVKLTSGGTKALVTVRHYGPGSASKK